MQIIPTGCSKAQTWENHTRANKEPHAIHKRMKN